jgi:hypothetical protein
MAALPAEPRFAPAASLSVIGSERERRATAANPTAVRERSQVRSPYPNYRITVLDDDVNTFQHVVDCLVKILPGMQPDLRSRPSCITSS